MQRTKSTERPKFSPARAALPLMLCLMTATISAGCANTIVATAEPFCQNVKPVCPVADDHMTDRTATRTLRNNEAMKASCGAKWAQCPRGAKAKPLFGPPAPVDQSTDPKTS